MKTPEESLEALKTQGLLRHRLVVEGPQGPRMKVDGKEFLCFVNNDYLGLSHHSQAVAAAQAALAQWGVGAGASALISGHSAAMEQLEHALCHWQGMPALHFSSGYMANTGILQALVQPEDEVFSDRLNHASLIDGVRLCRAGARHIYDHGDVVQLESQLKRSTAACRWIVTDAVFSMDGDLAPLGALIELAKTYDAMVVVDDAHGVGVLGEEGRGSLNHLGLGSERVIYMATLGKALGVSGAFVAAQEPWHRWLLQKTRTYMFTTGTPPALAAALLANLKTCRTESWRREQLVKLGQLLQQGLKKLALPSLPTASAIHPLIVGDNQAVLRLSRALWQQGLWVPAIRPPTVPQGSARLRISLSCLHTEADVDQLLEALRRSL
jgi:8-amino-7-oxononanoate synthase